MQIIYHKSERYYPKPENVDKIALNQRSFLTFGNKKKY